MLVIEKSVFFLEIPQSPIFSLSYRSQEMIDFQAIIKDSSIYEKILLLFLRKI